MDSGLFPSSLLLFDLGTNFVSDFPDRKSTRLNSSHRCISYAVFCLKKKNRIRCLIPCDPQVYHILALYPSDCFLSIAGCFGERVRTPFAPCTRDGVSHRLPYIHSTS